nr:hypothetical protein GCM10025699_32150 [Microbacterium flavescens]
MAQLVGLGRVEPRREILECVGVDVDAAREVGHLRDDVQAQPPGVAEQARVRQLARGDVQRELVVGHLEVAPEVREVLGEDGRLAVGHQRDADVAAAHDLLREVSHDLAQLRREERAADRPHEASGPLDEALHVVGGVLAECSGERVGDAGRHRLGELLPDRQGRLDPAAAGERLRLVGELRDRGRLAQPQGGQGERLVEVGALAGGDAEAVLIGDVQRLALGELPRDAGLAATRERTLEVPHHGLHHGGVDVHPRQRGELFGVELAGSAAEQLADQVLELFLGTAVVVCHFSRLSAGS